MSDDLQSQEVDAPSIDDEFKCLIRPLTEMEEQKLEASLLAEGCRDPLVVLKWGNVLLDGHIRKEICDEHDIDYDITEIDLPDRKHAILWILENQLGRRNLTEDQQAAMCLQVVELRSAIEKNKRAMKAGETGGKNCPKYLSLEAETTSKLNSESKERTRASVAKEFGITVNKLRDVAKIKRDSPEVFKKIAIGEISVRVAKKEKKARAAAKQPKPENKYPHSDQFRNLLKHITDQTTAMKNRHKTVAEMVADDNWDTTKTNEISICLHSTIKILMRYDMEFLCVLKNATEDGPEKQVVKGS